MIYKEWFSLRLKLILWLIVYFGAMLIYLLSNVWLSPMTVSIYQQDGQDIYNTLFGGWLKVLIMLTPAMALLGAIDLISEETGKGTISFIMTRPLTRSRIYATKILLSTATLIAIAGISSLLVLLIDQLPRQVLILRWTTNPCGDNAYCSGWNGGGLEASRPAELLPALAAVGIILVIGGLIVCSVGLLSIFTRSMVQTTAAAAPLLLITYLVLNGNGPFARVNQYQPMQTELLQYVDLNHRLSWMAGLIIAGVIVFFAGLLAFNRKEF